MLGNSLGGLFGGSSAAEPPSAATQAQTAQTNNSSWGNNCAGATEQFTKCMDEQGGNMQICGWYLEQLVCLHSSFYFSLSLSPPLGDACLCFCCCAQGANGVGLCRKLARLRLASTKLAWRRCWEGG
jgi:hypothetical protein